MKKSFANLLIIIIAMDHFVTITGPMINPLEMSSLRETAACALTLLQHSHFMNFPAQHKPATFGVEWLEKEMRKSQCTQ